MKICSGMKFNHLTVIKEAPSVVSSTGKDTYKRYWCECDCGTACKLVLGRYLKRNETQCCGLCWKHWTESIHYTRAAKILERCNNPKSDSYARYGGRGIKCLIGNNIREVVMFLENLPGYFEGAQIDRIDNNGHYSPDNVRWVTNAENQMNKSTNVTIESLAEKPRYHKDVKHICERHGWDINDFIKVRIIDKPGMYLYIAKINYNE
jgi:hypothetical protein|nr:MAG TPA: PROTEIN/DNA Complex catalytic motif, Helix-turn-helix DNA [Caudoviricetes sp.]